MATLTVTPEREIHVPPSEVDAAGLTPGQRVAVIRFRGRIELVPVPEPGRMFGALRGIDTTIEREPDRL